MTRRPAPAQGEARQNPPNPFFGGRMEPGSMSFVFMIFAIAAVSIVVVVGGLVTFFSRS